MCAISYSFLLVSSRYVSRRRYCPGRSSPGSSSIYANICNFPLRTGLFPAILGTARPQNLTGSILPPRWPPTGRSCYFTGDVLSSRRCRGLVIGALWLTAAISPVAWGFILRDGAAAMVAVAQVRRECSLWWRLCISASCSSRGH